MVRVLYVLNTLKSNQLKDPFHHLVKCLNIENNWNYRILSRFCRRAGGGLADCGRGGATLPAGSMRDDSKKEIN